MSDESKDWYEGGLSFSCTQCGNCCSGPPGFVWFDDHEAVAMAAAVGVGVEEFLHTYARKLRGKWSLNEVKRDGKFDCVFLNRDGSGKALCGLYKVRPQQCKTWPFWPELLVSEKAWKEASRKCPGMDTGKFFPVDQVRIIRDSNPAV